MTDTYCPLPWIHLGTHPHGGVTPCCISDHTAGKNRARNYTEHGDQFFNLNDQDINTHMNSDYFKELRLQMLQGEKPAACMRCYDEELKGVTSKRQTEINNYPNEDYFKAARITQQDGEIPLDLRFVELRLGNVCNVKCRTCNPASSSRWRKEYDIIASDLSFINHGYTWLNHEHDFQWPEYDHFYDDLYECAPNMEVLYINGGEPTLIEAHWRYLEKLVVSGRSKNITLWYNINMTNLPERAIPLWQEFKEARICPSIDDLEVRNHFIRYPTKWDSVTENLEKLLSADLNVRITQTVSAYNYAYLDEFLFWAPCPVDMNFVYDPHYLSPQVLPVDLRKSIHDRYSRAFSNKDQHHLQTLLNMYDNTEWNADHWKEFCEYNDKMDELRPPLKWRDVFPEIA